MSFQERPDDELHHLDDDDLVAYGRAARAAGNLAAARRALAFLIYGYESNVTQRVSLRLPAHAVADVAHDALVRAVGAAFDGQSVGEFRSWLHTITDRTVADYYRRAERRPKETILPSEHADDESVWGEEPTIEAETAAIELRMIVDDVMGTLSEAHRQVVDLHVFERFPAVEVCERIDGMSEANVAQIASRFRARLRARLDATPGGSP